jgi:hypothetical protein
LAEHCPLINILFLGQIHTDSDDIRSCNSTLFLNGTVP